MKPHGYGGKVLRVDLTTGTMVEEPGPPLVKPVFPSSGTNGSV